ncbi:MAG TPA: SDR family oxidoreductase [Candidatus Binataceae bacterium]|jgi:NAD(P)-dependent dehydrogenase (short-subunit alcohol dehydrogenase family)
MAARLQDRICLITGGASGIGRAAALAFAREGATLTIADVSAGGEETARIVRNAGGQAVFTRCDISVPAGVEALIAGIVDRHGRLDCAFNNAGIEGPLVPMAEVSEELWDRIIRVDLRGVWLCLKHEVRQMMRQGYGAIVNTSSTAGICGTPGYSPYTAAKHGVIGLTRSVALQCAKSGIRVNAICPGLTDTPMMDRILGGDPEMEKLFVAGTPIGRKARPDEIAAAAVWLCSEDASFVTGAIIPVDGGVFAQ